MKFTIIVLIMIASVTIYFLFNETLSTQPKSKVTNQPKSKVTKSIDFEKQNEFMLLRLDAKKITVGMSKAQVISLLGVSDFESPWLSHLPTWKRFYFDVNRTESLGNRPKSYISVLIDSKNGVKTVDVYDPIFESCNGNKIDSTCEPINRKHHDRLAGPNIISG